MPFPNFTNDEQYLINCVKSPKAVANSSSYMWGYLFGGALFAAIAMYNDNLAMMSAAFVMVCGFRIFEERTQKKWTLVWQSIIEKYETCSDQANSQ